jgi:hypothetical protein
MAACIATISSHELKNVAVPTARYCAITEAKAVSAALCKALHVFARAHRASL